MLKVVVVIQSQYESSWCKGLEIVSELILIN